MKKLIVNADDFGFSKGINNGIIESHVNGIVTSTSLMVKGKAALHAVELAKNIPKLGVGLHFQITKEEMIFLRQIKKITGVAKIEDTKKEFIKQIELFKKLVGRLPDHIDGHHHVHKLPRIYPFIRKFAESNNIPLRDDVNFIDNFFAVKMVSDVSPKSLIKILKSLPDGISELMCHPAKDTMDFISSYSSQRKIELKTLTSDKVDIAIQDLGIKLISWKEI